MSKQEQFNLDRTAFKINTFESAEQDQKDYWQILTPMERLAASWYLTCQAYNLDYTVQHKLDRTVFSMRKRED